MNIGIIDADLLDSNTKFPNLALMKISSYQKQIGNDVSLTNWNEYNNYDHIFVSKVFDYSYSPEMIKYQDDVTIGGTGFFFDKSPQLPKHIEHSKPDYQLYADVPNDREHKYYHIASIGFTTRGCFRHCGFCVNRNANKVIKWSDINEFYNPEKRIITMLDDNILGYKNRMDIINQLMELNKPFEYKQGMDIRLINDDISELFTHTKYYGDFIFAFDDWNDRHEIIPKIEQWQIFHGETKKNTKFYTLCGYKSTDIQDIKEVFERIRIMMEYRCLPYIMRYSGWNQSEFRGMYINLARWCNQPSLFKKLSLNEFIENHKEDSATVRYHDEFKKHHPEIIKEFGNLKYGEI